MTNPSEEYQRFEETVDTLNKVLVSHRAELNKAKNVARSGVVVGIIGIIVGLIGGAVGFDGRSRAQDIVAARNEARISGCIQSNVATQGSREALASSILVFADDPNHLTPKEQIIADAYRSRVEHALPYRDCSPEGLDRYFDNPPADPAAK